MSQSIIEIIRERKSVRDFQKKEIPSETLQLLKAYIAGLKIPFEAKVRIEIVHADASNEKQKLGTYGVISGAGTFLVTAYEATHFAELALGYVFEEVVLYCTRLGLGTCWLGGTFKGKDFAKAIRLQTNEFLSIVSPVGWPAEKLSFIGNVFATMTRRNTRKPFETLFFKNNESVPLQEQEAGKYQLPLEMVRLAPSASNKQPWRTIVDGENVHFYRIAGGARFTKIDLGIALCHFDLTCKEAGIGGHFMEDPVIRETAVKGWEYIMSWIGEQK